MEPLHEYLFDMPEQELRDFLPTSITSMMRHPEIDSFYFAEYPFRPEGGVPHFEQHFPYRRYCLDPDASDPLLERYIESLLQLAWQNNQRPVLQFNRALLRAGWLANRFNSRTVLLLRRPFDTWKSFVSFENLYFPTVMSMIVGQNTEDPAVRSIARRHEVPCYIGERFAEEYEFYRAFAKARLDHLYPVFYELCMVSNLHAAKWADVVIDMNEVSANPAARAFTTRELGRIGIDMPLDDCAIPVHAASTPEEKRWLSLERVSRMALRSELASPLGVPVSRVSAVWSGLGRCWRSILDEHSR